VGNPITQRHEILSLKTRVLVILACTVLIGLHSVTDGRTDTHTHTHRHWPWLRRAKHSCRA